MTTVVTHHVGPSATLPAVAVHRVTAARVLRSEWIKLSSLRSTAWTLAAAVVTLVAMGWVFGWASSHYWSDMRPDEQAAFNAIDTSLAGYNLAQLAVGVLGVLLVTGEYATGMIRSTFGAVPRRLPVLWAKSVLYAGVTFVLMLGAAVVSFVGAQQLLGSHGTTLSADGAVRAIVGVAGYLTLIAVFAVAVGFIVRSTAGGIAALFALLMVLPTMGLLLPASWKDHLLPYLPGNAGSAVISTRAAQHSLSAGSGLLVLLIWVAVALTAASLRLKRRDA